MKFKSNIKSVLTIHGSCCNFSECEGNSKAYINKLPSGTHIKLFQVLVISLVVAVSLEAAMKWQADYNETK